MGRQRRRQGNGATVDSSMGVHHCRGPKGVVEGRAERKRTWGGGRAGSVLEEQIERAFELATARYRYLAVNWLGQRNLRASGERALSFSMVGANQQTLDISVFLLPLRYSLNLHAFRK